MRIVSLNLRAYFGPGGSQIQDLAVLIASHKPDVVLLEEARPGWLHVVCRAAGLNGAYSLDVGVQFPGRLGDGCAIAVRSPLRIERVWRLEPRAFEPAVVAGAIDEPVPCDTRCSRRRWPLASQHERCSRRSLAASAPSSPRSFMRRLVPAAWAGSW